MLRPTVAEAAEEMIAEKRAAGFSWSKQADALRRFCRYCSASGIESAAVTKEAVDGFVYGRGLRASTVRRAELLLNEFGEWLRGRGVDAYVCPVATELPHVARKDPYIFSDDEVRRFFAAVDGQRPTDMSNKSVVDPCLFRVLYDTGLRVSEALALAVGDVDLESEGITVRRGKNGRDRIVPICPRLAEALDGYMDVVHPGREPDRALFYTRDPHRRMSSSQVHARFREYLLEADIPRYSGGPKVHSFRHGFAVGNLKAWAREGADLHSRVPLLCAYMGHANVEATEYYLRLTADMYPEINDAVQRRFGQVIPKGGAPWC